MQCCYLWQVRLAVRDWDALPHFLKCGIPCPPPLGIFRLAPQSDLCPFSSQTSVLHVTDTYPPVGDNGIDLCVRAEVCPSTKTAPRSCQANFGQALFDNLRRFAGVSGS